MLRLKRTIGNKSRCLHV